RSVPFVFEVRDLWPQTLIDFGRIRSAGPVAGALRKLERTLYRRSTRVISVLPGALDYIASLGVDPERIMWIPNGVDLNAFPRSGPAQSGTTFTVMYFGS